MGKSYHHNPFLSLVTAKKEISKCGRARTWQGPGRSGGKPGTGGLRRNHAEHTAHLPGPYAPLAHLGKGAVPQAAGTFKLCGEMLCIGRRGGPHPHRSCKPEGLLVSVSLAWPLIRTTPVPHPNSLQSQNLYSPRDQSPEPEDRSQGFPSGCWGRSFSLSRQREAPFAQSGSHLSWLHAPRGLLPLIVLRRTSGGKKKADGPGPAQEEAEPGSCLHYRGCRFSLKAQPTVGEGERSTPDEDVAGKSTLGLFCFFFFSFSFFPCATQLVRF